MSLPTVSKLTLPGRRFAWPFSPTESIVAFVVGWAVWYLLDVRLFIATSRDNAADLAYFRWVCPVLANACALSAISFLRALRGGTPGVSRDAYFAMTFPFWQTIGYFALVASSQSGAAPWTITTLFVLSLSLPAQFVVSVIAASGGSVNRAQRWNGLSLLSCIAWYVFLFLIAAARFKSSF